MTSAKQKCPYRIRTTAQFCWNNLNPSPPKKNEPSPLIMTKFPLSTFLQLQKISNRIVGIHDIALTEMLTLTLFVCNKLANLFGPNCVAGKYEILKSQLLAGLMELFKLRLPHHRHLSEAIRPKMSRKKRLNSSFSLIAQKENELIQLHQV
ncbi:unnamed protein product [Nesidiocoris tenuis]|uniref:Uncharacterized protein n=1 Tax=Nesidiocoris tenuis TaxID=355587 RepID=A0A6H5H5H5_9HEMI|nr:unnamed protein product [Nesidiocoris tenuis]